MDAIEETDKILTSLSSQDQLPQSDEVQLPTLSRTRPKSHTFHPYKGVTYQFLRWPLLWFIGLILFIELLLYISVRWWVKAWESIPRFTKSQRLRKTALANARSFEEWKSAALQLDYIENKEAWKQDPYSPFYDSSLISSLKNQITSHIKTKNIPKLIETLKVAAQSNLGGIDNQQLYSYTYYGTKRLIEDYVAQVVLGLKLVFESDCPLSEKKQLYKHFMKTYGRTALCLSGGARMCFYHLGVVKCLLEQRMLPTVITGTSGGAMIAAFCCVRTDAELLQDINPDLYKYMDAVDEPVWVLLARFIRHGVVFDINRWIEKMHWIAKGDTTFYEAYQRTGKVLNITVIPTEKHSPPVLLNYKTAPNVVIYSAVLASASIPGMLKAGELLVKNKDGSLEPYYLIGKQWRDGSLKTDIPVTPLHRSFNVNFTIVSQVNPHIVLFFYSSKGSVGEPSLHRHGRGLRGGFILSSIERFLKLDMLKWLRFLKGLDLLPVLLGADGSFLFLQRFHGTITVVPKPSLRDYLKLFGSVSREDMERFIRLGEKNTWPKLNAIANRMNIELTLLNCKKKLQMASLDNNNKTEKIMHLKSATQKKSNTIT